MSKRNGVLTWSNIRVKLGALQPWADNPRLSSKRQAERILQSFGEFGQVQTIAIGPKLQVYDGHQRLSALLTLHGPAYTLDARQASRALTNAERKRLVLLLHSGAVGAWDWDALSGWDADLLQAGGLDAELLSQLNRDQAALISLLESENGETPAYVEPQTLPEQWIIVVTCDDERQQNELFERFTQEGLTCRLLIS